MWRHGQCSRRVTKLLQADLLASGHIDTGLLASVRQVELGTEVGRLQIGVGDLPYTDPTIYVAITSKSDPDHAPAGCENWFVLVNAPALGSTFDWATQEADYRQRVFATLASFGLDIQTRLRSQTILTPVDLAQRTGAWRGALYGISSNQALNAFRRPHNRSAQVRRLYFVGGTTHPGGGVPMVTLSGKVVAEMVLADKEVT